jgi:Ni,Fe-hydrogenase III small subunit
VFKLFKNGSSIGDLETTMIKDSELLNLEKRMKEIIREKFSSTLHLYIVDTGSCKGCELEFQALFNQFYNVSSMGIEVVYEIETADILCITGLMTENLYFEIERLYEKMRAPKRVINIGDCPLFHAPFKNSYALKNQGANPFEVAYSIAGCPPEPRTILRELFKYLKKV